MFLVHDQLKCLCSLHDCKIFRYTSLAQQLRQHAATVAAAAAPKHVRL